MIFIVGLGNPGTRYQYTRHNAGFLAIDQIALELRIKMTLKGISLLGNGFITQVRQTEQVELAGQTGITLIKPLTYMNLSGRSLNNYKNSINKPSDLIVIHDDIDIDTGRIKIKQGGSSGGHKGVQSIIDILGQNDFIRVKIGVGRDINIPAQDYVLTKFNPDERVLIDEAIINAKDAVISIIYDGINIAMNNFN